jgi:hypothetical protein
MRKRISLATIVFSSFSLASLVMSVALGCTEGSILDNSCSNGSVSACSCANGQPGTQQCFGGVYMDCQCEASSGAAGSTTVTSAYTGGSGVATSGAAGTTGLVTTSTTGGRTTATAGTKSTRSKATGGTGGAISKTSKSTAGTGGTSPVKGYPKCPKPYSCIEDAPLNVLMITGKYCADPSKPDAEYGVIPPLCTNDDDCVAVGITDTKCQNMAGMIKVCLVFCSP